MTKPYLSIVATSRNDGHSGDVIKRMKLFVNGLIEQTRKYNVDAELIIVEWNPLPEQPLLHEILPKPKPGDKLVIRYIIVPVKIHKSYKRSATIPLYQMIAKNVGIKRARGEFILCTNVDLIFSDKLFESFAQKNLKKNFFYRANRCDVPDTIEDSWEFNRQLKYCEENIIRRIGKNPKYPYLGTIRPQVFRYPFLVWWINLIFGMARFFLWNNKVNRFNNLDTHASGDFTLMSKDAWEDIRGYLELDLFAVHIDTMALVCAASLGFKQHIFQIEECVYHIDHPMGWETMNPEERIKFWEERPGMGYDAVWDSAMVMMDKPTTLNINKPDWGWANEQFEEIVYPQQLVKQKV